MEVEFAAQMASTGALGVLRRFVLLMGEVSATAQMVGSLVSWSRRDEIRHSDCKRS